MTTDLEKKEKLRDTFHDIFNNAPLTCIGSITLNAFGHAVESVEEAMDLVEDYLFDMFSANKVVDEKSPEVRGSV